MSRSSVRRVVLALALTVACGRDRTPAPAPAADPAIQSLTADPPIVHPGEGTTLRAEFTGGSGRVEPGVGPVESGRPVAVAPYPGPRVFTLVVTSAADPAAPGHAATAGGGAAATGREVRRELVVPFAYRERLAPRGASPSARTGHGGALLADGRVLVVGGSSAGGTGWSSADLVDPATGSHTPAGTLWTARTRVPVVALAGGGALALGGDTDVDEQRSVERWDRGAGVFTRLADLREPRLGHAVTLLPGGEVLVTGSEKFLGRPPASRLGAELYDPAGLGTSRAPAGGDLVQVRYGHTATLLPDGRVLVVGGWDAYSGVVAVSAELYDPATESFALAGTLRTPRGGHAAVLLGDGRVLVVGGGDWELAPTAEVWTPGAGFAPAGDLVVPRWDAPAVLLATGEVLVLGGTDVAGRALASAELWRPGAGITGEGEFTLREGVLTAARRGFVVVRLADGRVLVHGGEPGSGYPVPDVAVWE